MMGENQGFRSEEYSQSQAHEGGRSNGKANREEMIFLNQNSSQKGFGGDPPQFYQNRQTQNQDSA
jgi:hypothetical protein